MSGTLVVQNLQGPASGANANKIIVPAGQVLDASAGTLVPSAGGVIQVANVYSTNGISVTSTTRISLDSYSFTPVGTASKFVITFFLQANWGGSPAGFGAYMYRNGVEIAASGNSHSVYINTVSDTYQGSSWSFIDNSGSTAGTPITFELRAQPYSPSLVQFSWASQSRGFVIMEIAG